MKNLITVEQLSAWIHKSVSSIRSDATRNPHSLPPICRLPGTKRLLWRIDDVEHWLELHVTDTGSAPDAQPSASQVTTQRKRGRPTKAEQVARGRSSVGSR
jgi:hypothetical protein